MPKYKNELWDGKITLFDKKTKLLPLGLFPILTKFLEKNKIKHKFNKNDFKKIEIPDKEILQLVKNFNDSSNYKPRYYQIKGLFLALKNNKSIIELPTGSGKSYIIFLFIKFLLNEYSNFLLIVPKKSLVFQMKDEFENYEKGFSKNIHTIVAGCPKTSDKSIHISTWQSIYKLNYSHFKQYRTLIIDECHLATANSIRKISEKCTNAVFRLGTTATVEDNNKKLILIGNFEKIYGDIEKTKKLIDNKFLSDVIIYHIIIKHPLETRLDIASLNFKNFNYEIKIALKNKNRYKLLLKTIIGINKNNLILFKRISFGKKLFKDLKNVTKRPVYYIDGKIKVKEREDIRKKLEIENNAIVIASNQIFSTGINVKNLHYITITVFNKSKIAVMQTIGRGLRKYKDKKNVKIIDFVDDMQLSNKEKKEHETKSIELHTKRNLLLQHFYDRIKIYKEEGFEYRIKRIKL